MSDGTHIGWTDATQNVLVGCTKISEGCKNCSALRDSQRLSHNPHPKIAAKYEGVVTEGGKNWTGRINFSESDLFTPLRWRKARMIFPNYTSDWSHVGVRTEWKDKLFAVMALCQLLSRGHVFQGLTKRADLALAYLTDPETPGRVRARAVEMVDALSSPHVRAIVLSRLDTGGVPWPLPNFWHGVSAENQEKADERVPFLLQTPAAVRWVSAEPLLGPVDLRLNTYALLGSQWTDPDHHRLRKEWLHWVVAGGESGKDARPMHPDWARSLRDQCAAAGVPFFFKQWGEWVADGRIQLGPPSTLVLDGYAVFPDGQEMKRVGKKNAGALLDGREWKEFPLCQI